MKFLAALALVTLAFSCTPAAAMVCESFLHVLTTIFMGTLSDYESAIQPFKPEPDMKDAGVKMKKLIDILPQETKTSIMKLSEKIIKSPQCTKSDNLCPSDLEVKDHQLNAKLPPSVT
ncbi:uteroglobin [Tamandua tetradactyla]|uniref:uteroglobin n=1 Tax=Tamandua tetradactyla TaxID=48850 RepID=UPI004053DE86